MRLAKPIERTGRRLFVVLCCVALAVWTVAPCTSHVPKIIETLQDHAEMVAEHGHSHGLEENLLWAMHGHSHESADHDHSQAVLLPVRSASGTVETRIAWRSHARSHGSPPLFRLERPPRA